MSKIPLQRTFLEWYKNMTGFFMKHERQDKEVEREESKWARAKAPLKAAVCVLAASMGVSYAAQASASHNPGRISVDETVQILTGADRSGTSGAFRSGSINQCEDCCNCSNCNDCSQCDNCNNCATGVRG
jgi:hypothetical protein